MAHRYRLCPDLSQVPEDQAPTLGTVKVMTCAMSTECQPLAHTVVGICLDGFVARLEEDDDDAVLS